MTLEPLRTEHARTWPLKCTRCGDRIRIELPPGTVEGRTGESKCRRGHELVYGYDGVTVRLLEFVGEER